MPQADGAPRMKHPTLGPTGHMTQADTDEPLLVFSDPEAMKCFNVVFDRPQSAWDLIDPENAASQRVAEKIGMTVARMVDRGGKTYALYSVLEM